MRFKEIIAEALPLSTAKEYRKAWNPDSYKELFAKYNAKYRIYIPFDVPERNPEIPDDIKKHVTSKGYIITDYIGGKATDQQAKQQFKIGKLLADEPDLQKKFQTDPQRGAKKDTKMFAVISRHPYDIAGMSTNRHWHSCMSLEDGERAGSMRHFVIQEVKKETLVAYAVRPNDLNINNPLARYSMKVFVNEFNKSEHILVRETNHYGTLVPGFMETIDKWLAEYNQGKEYGLFCRTSGVYNDDNSEDAINNNIRYKGPDKITDPKDQLKTAKRFTSMRGPLAIEFFKKFVNPPKKVIIAAISNNSDVLSLFTRKDFTDQDIVELTASKLGRTLFDKMVANNYTFSDDLLIKIIEKTPRIYNAQMNFFNNRAKTNTKLKTIINNKILGK